MTKPETKQDVFCAMAVDNSIDHQSMWYQRYNAALQDDLPVIPKEVSEYIKRYHIILNLFGLMQKAFRSFDTPLDDPIQTKEHWIANHQKTFALAWVLEAWIVEETGEVVKL